jgi:hypothetical protein
MPFLCTKLSQDELKRINMYMLSRVPHNKLNPHPLFDDVMTSQVMIETNDPTTLVFLSHRGLFFERRLGDEDVETTIHRMFEAKTQSGIVTPFVVDQDDPTVTDKLLTRFQESYGTKLTRQIDHYIYYYDNKKLMLVKFSPSVLRFTMAPSGGTLKTTYKGPIESLKQIPTLCKFVTGDNGELEEGKPAVFATQYSEGSLPIVSRIHYDIVREVIARPNQGICIGPVAVWDA